MWHGQCRSASINCKQATLITQDGHVTNSRALGSVLSGTERSVKHKTMQKSSSADINVNFKLPLKMMLLCERELTQQSLPASLHPQPVLLQE